MTVELKMERAFQILEHSRVETDSTILKPGETGKGILGMQLSSNKMGKCPGSAMLFLMTADTINIADKN